MRISKSFRIDEDVYLTLQTMANSEGISDGVMLEKLILEHNKALEQINKLQEELELKDKEIKALKDKLISYDARLKECEGKWNKLEISTKRVLDKFEETTNGLGDALESVVEMTSKQTAKKYFVYSLIVSVLIVILVIALVVGLRWL
ncbi:hypothetical protein [Hydrogenobaculum acidophilum]